MKNSRQKKQLLMLSGLLVVLAYTVYHLVFSYDTSPSQGKLVATSNLQSPGPVDLKDILLKRNPKRTGGKKETSFQEIDPSIHLEKLENFDPGSPLNARNMFSLETGGAVRVASNTKPGRPGVGSATGPTPALGAGTGPGQGGETSSVASVRPPVVINLKFFGVQVDQTKRKRQGFFADGEEIFLASEGDLVANRYRVVRIGDSSAEIEEVSSKTRRQISMATQ